MLYARYILSSIFMEFDMLIKSTFTFIRAWQYNILTTHASPVNYQ